jgi:uncharacterized membrane protein
MYLPALINGITGLVLIILGIPLIYRKVKRNHIYGYRISRYIMENDTIWYEVNARGGRHLVILGTIAVILAISSFYSDNTGDMMIISYLSPGIIIAGLLFSWYLCLKQTWNMADAMNLKKSA